LLGNIEIGADEPAGPSQITSPRVAIQQTAHRAWRCETPH
jgi:hypothetical protein